ncbi:MAG: NUDIX hydrolase [Chloroflexi bacterium]|nr:NUDIX hydrolase [Chloroflexota bacterium]MBU1746879.1 NUDIX hydrolase [Chloroflexota bacterium]
MAEPRWLEWARGLQAIAQNGLLYTENPFDQERYEAMREIAAEMLAAGSGEEPARIRELFAGETGYATPKVDVRGAVFRDDALLMVRERRNGLWTPPGGWADVNDSPAEAVVREVYEESGYRTRAVKLLALCDRNKHPHTPHPFHIYKLFFLCELVGGEPASSVETDGVAFFGEHELPPLSIGHVTPGQIGRLFEHHRHPNWRTDFD